jgi:hypothetical protein
MSIHAVEERHDEKETLKPLTLNGEKLKRYEYCGFTADSFGELQVQVEELGLQWHPEAVIDTATGMAVGK